MTSTLLFVAPQADFFLSHRAHLATAAQGDGWRAVVACPPSRDVDALEGLGLDYAPLPVARAGFNPVKEARTVFSLLAIISRERPRAAHLITAKAALWGGLACWLSGVPSVTAITGLGFLFAENSPRNRLVRRLLLSLYGLFLDQPANHFVFQNRSDLAVFQRAGVLKRATIHLLPGSGVDLLRIAPRPEPVGPPVVLLPARMLRIKGIEDFRAAARILHDQGVAVVMRLAGAVDQTNPSGVSPQELAAWAASGEVEWIGHQADMNRVLADCNIVALPSRGGEGLPKTLIDAAAAGRPAVTTDTPGCADAVVDGETGLLCRPRDAADLAAKLRCLIEDADLRARMGKAARARAETVFDIQSVIRAHLDIYRALADRAGQG